MNFRLPPLPEQKRIVAKVEELLTQVNAARSRLPKVSKFLKRFRQSLLAAACSGRLTEGWRKRQCEHVTKSELHSLYDPQEGEWPDLPESWRSADVEAICSEIVDCPHSTPKWTESGAICLRTTNFRAGSLDLSEVRYVSESTYKKRISRLEPREGDVLYSREGGILGLSCMVPSGTRVCLGQRMMLMRAKSELYHPTFLMHVLNSPDTNARVRDLTGGSASPHLNVATIKGFPVPLPPFAEQQEIVRRVEALFKLADAIEKRVEAASKRADKLTQAILRKAFRGELVPTEAELARTQGRDYETAQQLLSRIAALGTAARRLARRSQKDRNLLDRTGGISQRIPMRTPNSETVLAAVAKMKSSEFSFDDLREAVPGDYESLKQVVFDLLQESDPTLTQRFDEDTAEMKLVRMRK